MPMTVAQLKGNLRTINVTYFEDNVTVTYRPGELTPTTSSELQARIDSGESSNATVDLLCRAVVKWDVMADKDEMLPITPENLGALPGPFLLAIAEAIGEDGRPKPQSARGSFAR